MGPGGLENIISRCPHLSRGRATGHMIQERTTSWEIRGVKESGSALWGHTEASIHPGPGSEEHR